MLTYPSNHASYSVPVRQFKQRSLAYFSPNLTVNNLATYFSSRHDPSESGTYTLWDILIQELYLPFKAHTKNKTKLTPVFILTVTCNLKQLTFILISLIILTSCSSNKEITGIWIGDYQLSSKDGEPWTTPHNILLDFSNDSVTTKILQYWASKPGSPYGLIKEPYSLKGTSLSIDSTDATVRIEGDSLIINYKTQPDDSFVFKRVKKNQNQPKVDLVNKVFLTSGLARFDSLEFLNDSIFIDIHNDSNRVAKLGRWTKSQYGPYTFLIFDRFLMPSYIITKDTMDIISLTGIYKKEFDVSMNIISHKSDTTGLNGKWFHPPRDFPPPPSFEKKDSMDFRVYLTIQNDSIEIKTQNSSYYNSLILNSTREYIWLRELSKRSPIWRITDLTANRLTIEKQVMTDRGPKVRTLIFEKIKTAGNN